MGSASITINQQTNGRVVCVADLLVSGVVGDRLRDEDVARQEEEEEDVQVDRVLVDVAVQHGQLRLERVRRLRKFLRSVMEKESCK